MPFIHAMLTLIDSVRYYFRFRATSKERQMLERCAKEADARERDAAMPRGLSSVIIAAPRLRHLR